MTCKPEGLLGVVEADYRKKREEFDRNKNGQPQVDSLFSRMQDVFWKKIVSRKVIPVGFRGLDFFIKDSTRWFPVETKDIDGIPVTLNVRLHTSDNFKKKAKEDLLPAAYEPSQIMIEGQYSDPDKVISQELVLATGFRSVIGRKGCVIQSRVGGDIVFPNNPDFEKIKKMVNRIEKLSRK